jgi:tetratricopeptide (TPR) repeat protein
MTHLLDRRKRGWRRLVRHVGLVCGVWLGLGAGLSADAANRGVSDGLARVDEEVDGLEGRMNRLSREYGERRGLIGADEAVRRYEDAVYTFLIEDYERAALSFYTLVESEALTTEALHQDSEWYLAECLFQLENWNTALAAYRAIISDGTRHPYLGEAVRRSLEIYGLLRDNEQFYDVYRTYVLSGIVPATDGVKYTVAKSFYRQGEWGRAKAMFTELPVKSRLYPQARYFTGTILAAEGEFEAALAEFRRVEQVKGGDNRLEELVDLAIGRIHYELTNYRQAVESYQQVPSSSPYFADQLYEITWTYIKQGAWQEAIDSVEIFTVAFPDHPYTVRMRLVEGHLHRKSAHFERALATYESVVDEYTPVRARLADIEGDRQNPSAFFERLVNDETLKVSGVTLPPYAVELLVEHEGLRRAVAVRQELGTQNSTLDESEVVIEDVASVLRSPKEPVGTFARGRAGLQRVRDDSLALRIRLLEIELDHLESGAASSLRSAIQDQRVKLEILVGQAQVAQGEAAARSNRYQSYADQVATVQAEAGRVGVVAARARGELLAMERQFRDRAGSLTPAAREQVNRQLGEVRAAVLDIEQQVATHTSDARRRTLLTTVPAARDDGNVAIAGGISVGLDALHRDVRTLRSQNTSADAASFSKVDQYWVRVHDADARAVATGAVLDQVEQVEVAVLKRTLEEQVTTVEQLGGEVDRVTSGTRDLAVDITRASLNELETRLFETILEADMGIVDVYWLRKSEVVERRQELKTERSDRISEMEARFALIRQKLEE